MINAHPQHFDVAIVGAGPAGSSAAFHLAKKGHRVVLMDRTAFPRDKACGDGLTSQSTELLEEMGLADILQVSQTVAGIQLHAHGNLQCAQASSGAVGKIVPRKILDAAMVKRAEQQGALLWQNTRVRDVSFSSGSACALDLEQAKQTEQITADFVIAADGGRSAIAEKAGLFQPADTSVGVAMRGYYHLTTPVAPSFHIHIPLTLEGYDHSFAGYGWVFPVNGKIVNIGVGLFPLRQTQNTPNLRQVFDHFLAILAQQAAFLNMRSQGRLKGGLLVSGNDPHQCYGRGVLLVGDAAGLVDPFTGEGIYAAIKSGKQAAQVLDHALLQSNRHTASLHAYGDLLNEEFRDRFRAGERFLQTYAFTWRVVEETIKTQGKLFQAVRDAAFDFTDLKIKLAFEPKDHRYFDSLPVLIKRGIKAVAKRFDAILNKHNPFFAKMANGVVNHEMSFLRLSLFFTYCCAENDTLSDDAIAAATAIEMCYLAFEIQSHVIEEPCEFEENIGRASETRWANTFTLMASNCLLNESYSILAQLDDDIGRLVSETSSEYCAARMEQTQLVSQGPLSLSLHTTLCEQMSGALFGLSCALGVSLRAGSLKDINDALSLGRKLGVICQLFMDTREVINDASAASQHPLMERIRRADPSYPITWSHNQHPLMFSSLASINSAEDSASITHMIHELRNNGSLNATVDKAHCHLTEAIEALNKQADNKTKQAVSQIINKLSQQIDQSVSEKKMEELI